MRRVITQIGQSIYEWLFTQQAQDNMVSMGKLAAAVLGTSTVANGLTVTPTTPASMQVSVSPGEIYALAALEATVCGTLPSDTTHQIVKQGILLDQTLLGCAAPPTAGQSINYLIQAQYQDVDVSLDPTNGMSPVVLQYFNSANPTQPYSGPNNSGATSNTFRNGSIALSAKAGIAATTGSQLTPAPDVGCVGLYVVSVANGQATITAGNISQFGGASTISERLTQKISQTTGDARYAALAGLGTQLFSVAAATSANHAVNLGQFVNSLLANGYARFPGSAGQPGLIIQMGITTAVASGGVYSGAFPIPFPTAALQIVSGPAANAVISQNYTGAAEISSHSTFNIYSFVSGGGSGTFRWIAVGY